MSLAGLKTFDVDRRRADRLRAKCHSSLRSRTAREARPARSDRPQFRRMFAPGLAGAWCVLYLLEIIRRAVVIYGH